MTVRQGPLILADISGYTAFVADTELEHSRAILNELLETLVRAIGARLRIGQIEGDAVFGVGDRMPPRPIEWLQESFVLFQRRLRDIQAVTSCPCRACASVGTLTLKFVAHYGEYLPQQFGNKETYIGRDVNLVHRLLKNSVPSHEYLLATSAFIEHMPVVARAGFVPHHERYDAGEMSGGYIDLASLREQARADTDGRVVESDHARLILRQNYQTTRDRLWHVLTDPEAKRRWKGAQRVDYQPGARGTLLGSEFHCEHGTHRAVYRVVSAVAPDQLTTVVRTPLALVWETSRVVDAEAGTVDLVRSFHWDRVPGPKGWFADRAQRFITRMVEGRSMRIIDTIVKEPAESPPAVAPGSESG